MVVFATHRKSLDMLKELIEQAYHTAEVVGETIPPPRWDGDLDPLLGHKSYEILPYLDKTLFEKTWDKDKKERISLAKINGSYHRLLMLPIRIDFKQTGYIVAISSTNTVSNTKKTIWTLQKDLVDTNKIRLSYHLSTLNQLKLVPEDYSVRDIAIDYLMGMASFRDKIRDELDTQGNYYYKGLEYISLAETSIPTQHPAMIFGLLKDRYNNPLHTLLLHEIYEA